MYKAFDKWLLPYILRRRPAVSRRGGPVHLLLAVCDHFEPFHDSGGSRTEALARVRCWQERFPEIVDGFKAQGGIGPRHTFFYPVEQYDREVLDAITAMARAAGAELEIHLHHDGDDAQRLRERIERGKSDLLHHGWLSRDDRGEVRYGFIHGDWALDNSHPSGRHCGVSNELAVLRQTGCYADFTLPSAPSPTQTRIVNSVYYARSTPRPKSHDRGTPLATGGAGNTSELARDPETLLLVQGPLGLNWRRCKFGLLPRVENGDLAGLNPPVPDRLELWLKIAPRVTGRADIVFVKLHTHGGISRNYDMLLGEPMKRFHRHLLQHYNDGSRFCLHYVSAREMVNVLHGVEAGMEGGPEALRDCRYRRIVS